MAKPVRQRRTQAERRARSRQAVLDSACRLFGEKGYAGTSLEEISADCGLTIRPVYHYFGNKKALFAAVVEKMSARILDTMSGGHAGDPDTAMQARWRAFLDLCDDPAFRRIVLIDSPNILGRDQWSESVVYTKASSLVGAVKRRGTTNEFRYALLNRVMMTAMAEAALMVAESDNLPVAKREAERLIMSLFARTGEFSA